MMALGRTRVRSFFAKDRTATWLHVDDPPERVPELLSRSA